MRIFFDSILFLSLFVAPWWVSSILALAGVFFFGNFYEIIVAGFIMDLVYGPGNGAFPDRQFVSTFAAALLLAGGLFIKKRLVFYP